MATWGAPLPLPLLLPAAEALLKGSSELPQVTARLPERCLGWLKVVRGSWGWLGVVDKVGSVGRHCSVGPPQDFPPVMTRYRPKQYEAEQNKSTDLPE